MITYYESPYRAYPWQMRGQFCEFQNGDSTRFIEIYSIEYNPEDINRLKRIDCLEDSIGEYIELIGKDIPPETFHLYKLETYLANPLLEDFDEFNESIREFTTYGFTGFNELINFCYDRWGLLAEDFVPLSETHIPR